MNTNKLRIPRVVMAVLVLGGAACDDETKKKSAEVEEQEGNKNPNEMKDDAGSGSMNGKVDAGADNEEEDAQNSGPQTGNIDVSQERITKVAADFCMSVFTCDQEYASEDWVDQDTCVADQVSYFEEYTSTYGDKCGDAQLDFYACMAEVDCDADPDTACEEEFGVLVTECL